MLRAATNITNVALDILSNFDLANTFDVGDKFAHSPNNQLLAFTAQDVTKNQTLYLLIIRRIPMQ